MSTLNMAAIVWDVPENTISEIPEISYKFTADPLLLSCTLYRLIKESRENDSVSYLNWSLNDYEDEIISKSIEQDRFFAEKLRSYYRSKLLVAKLRNENFTTFRTDLSKYLESSPTTLTSNFVGMIYKLPYFYEYDMKLTEIFDGEYRECIGPRVINDILPLTFIDKVDNSRKRSTVYEYWFIHDNGDRVMIEIPKKDPLMLLWEKHIKNNTIYIKANFNKKNKDNWSYYVAALNWEINFNEN